MKCKHGVYIPQPINLRSKIQRDGAKKILPDFTEEFKQWSANQTTSYCSVCVPLDPRELRKQVSHTGQKLRRVKWYPEGRPFVEFPKLEERRLVKDRPASKTGDYLGGDVSLNQFSLAELTLEELKAQCPEWDDVKVREFYEYVQENARPTNPDAAVFISHHVRNLNCQCIGCLLDRAEMRGEHQHALESERWAPVSLSNVGSSQNLRKCPVTLAPRKWTYGRAVNHALSLQEWDTDADENSSLQSVENIVIAKMDGTRECDYPTLRDNLEYQRSELEIAASAAEKIEGFILWEVQRVLSNRSKYDGTMNDEACAASLRRYWRRRKWKYPAPHPVMRWYPSPRPDHIPERITQFVRNITPDQFTRLRQKLADLADIAVREQTVGLWNEVMKSIGHLLHTPESSESKAARLGVVNDKKIGTSAR